MGLPGPTVPTTLLLMPGLTVRTPGGDVTIARNPLFSKPPSSPSKTPTPTPTPPPEAPEIPELPGPRFPFFPET